VDMPQGLRPEARAFSGKVEFAFDPKMQPCHSAPS
jgi:hypothetical protein